PFTCCKSMPGCRGSIEYLDICTHFYLPPPKGYIFNIFDIFVANSFVKVSIYRKLASRNHNLAGYELFMSIYNLQTRTGLNNSSSFINFIDNLLLYGLLIVGPRH